MRYYFGLTLLLSVCFSLQLTANPTDPDRFPGSLKIWGEQGNQFVPSQSNVACEMISMAYQLPADSLTIVELSIIDSQGQIMARRIVSSDYGKLQTRIEVGRWPEGNYQLKVWVDGVEQLFPLVLADPIGTSK